MTLSRFRGRWLKSGEGESTSPTQPQSPLPTPTPTPPSQPAKTVASSSQSVTAATRITLPTLNPLEDKFGQWVAQHNTFLKGAAAVAGSGLSTMRIGNGWPYAWLEPNSPAATTLAQITKHKPAGLTLATHALLSHYLLSVGHSGPGKTSLERRQRPVHPLGVNTSSYLVGSAVVKLALTFYQDRAYTPQLAERLVVCLEVVQHHATLTQLVKTGRFWLLAAQPNPANLIATPGQPIDQLEGEALERLGYALQLYQTMTGPTNTFELSQLAQEVIRAGNFTSTLVTLTNQLEKALGQTVQIHLRNSDLEVVAANATLISDIEKTVTALLAHCASSLRTGK